MEPIVSVIMPVYNAKDYIEKTIQSILNQTFTDFELLIIDDCPTDGTMDIVNTIKDDRIRIIHNGTNKGIAYSRNNGLKNSKGKYIALMDHDDISLPQRFEKQVEFLEANEEISVVGGRYRMIDENDEFLEEARWVNTDPGVMKAFFLFANPYSNSEVMFRRGLALEHDIWYEDGMLGMEDFKFWIQCSQYGKMSNIEDLVLYRRLMKSSETGRVVSEKLEERLKLYSELQDLSLELSGFKLNDEQKKILHKVVSDGCGECETGSEMKQFYDCLVEIINQAKGMGADYVDGLRIIARSYFLSKTANIMPENFWK